MWFLRFLFGVIFIVAFCLVLISLMRDLSNASNDDKWEAKFRLYAIIASAVSFGILSALV